MFLTTHTDKLKCLTPYLFIYFIALQQHKAHYLYNNITLPHTAHGKNYIRGTHVLTHSRQSVIGVN